jgi:hypothetical protein
MIFKKHKPYTIYHPNDLGNPANWLMCNALIGAVSYKELGSPIEFGEAIAPKWYTDLKDDNQDDLEYVWSKQEEYLAGILSWIASKDITRCIFHGAYDNDEAWFHQKYTPSEDGSISWQSELAEDLTSVNVDNMYIEAEDGTLLVAYGTWDSLFVQDPTGTLPEIFKAPTIQPTELPSKA